MERGVEDLVNAAGMEMELGVGEEDLGTFGRIN